ncbi:MAG: hypothetical protein QXP31_07910 [Pyrobaculum sp.]
MSAGAMRRLVEKYLEKRHLIETLEALKQLTDIRLAELLEDKELAQMVHAKQIQNLKTLIKTAKRRYG